MEAIIGLFGQSCILDLFQQALFYLFAKFSDRK